MQNSSRILIDQAHNQAWAVNPELAKAMNPANPSDASYAKMAQLAQSAEFDVSLFESGEFSPQVLSQTDVLVIPHCSSAEWERTIGAGSEKLSQAELSAIEDFVRSGGSLLILAETEQPKYGNNLAELAMRFGISIQNATVQDPENCYSEVPTWVLGQFSKNTISDFGFRVESVCVYRAGTLALEPMAAGDVFMRSSESALPANAPLGVAVSFGLGRVVVLADSDLFGDDSIEDCDNAQLWLNLAGWLANAKVAANALADSPANWASGDPAWQNLATTVEKFRPVQQKDGSIDLSLISKAEVDQWLEELMAAIKALAPRFPHQSDYFVALERDLRAWADSGYSVPDFFQSLEHFRPDLRRQHQIEHLAVFAMYTQNGNPNRNLEAVITRTFWPDWLAEKEVKYNNPAFIPIEFVAFTKGYDTNSAVFFPETVAVREVSTYFWGGIFCDREAARFRRVCQSAKQLLHLPLPADAERLISDQLLAQETFVLWDLIHDRTHSRGDLPFDPFMIKQRMPFWMYALEELRCDLSTFRESLVLQEQGDRLAKYMQYAILFDRLFRFPITGDRVRNYDGLGGQIIFAHLHKTGALHWTDNRLTFDWDRVTQEIVNLCEQVENLYHEGINRSRMNQWIAAYEFVSGLVPPHPGSNWAKGFDALPADAELKSLVNLVLDDEFPLNVFYETLNRKLSDVIASTRGITA